MERLGHGGSGEVYRAQEVQLGRSVVVKVLRRDLAKLGNRTERFLREVKLASRLDHPYAAHVYAYGAEADGVVWIAMEHVRGVTLDELVATRGPMPPALFGPLFARLCEVVHTAHELGIVHRDIKGSNVMVVERAGQMLPKLLDFGIAKGMAGELSPGISGSDDELTGHGAILGSPHYMAPEQWGTAADADARTDIYALGVLAYFCLAGTLPFAGIRRLELARAHRQMEPPALPPHVPRAVAAAVERAMAKASTARWYDALAFGAAVQTAVGGSAPETVPLLDTITRETWSRWAPQPLADVVVRLTRATTTVEADAALHELVAITCRWFAVVALAQLRADAASAAVREHVRALVGRDDAARWLRLARAAAAASDSATKLVGFEEALAATTGLEQLAARRDDRDRARSASALAADVAALPDALRPLEPLLEYVLVAARGGVVESWQGARRRDREHVVVWGDPLEDGDVALLDQRARVVARLSPLVQVSSPLPTGEPELFLLWRTARGAARMVAAPWGYERDDDSAAQWLAALTTASDDTLIDTADDRSPYPGLAAYASDDASHFVGRERDTEALVNRLVAAPLIAVVGASGAGKTSFLHAGVMPRLAEGYEILAMRPGRHPLRTLAHLAGDGDVVERLRERGERAARGLVIVVDQLEEVSTLCSDPDEREQFARVLATAASDRDAPVRVVIGVRDDFVNLIETLEAFRGRFEVYVLATPGPDALRRIIVEPARRAQVVVEPRVVDEMVAAVAGRPGSLPLLSFTAAQLWETRERRRITYEAYVALGGVAGALSTYADQVYASLDHTDQETLRELFGRLVAPDGTRIPIPRAELEQLPGARGVLARLIDARLLVVREDAGVDVVELVHECLATGWQRLVRWRSDDAAERVLLADLRTAARRWTDSEHSVDLLWRGDALTELRRLDPQHLTDVERAFATASTRAAQRARRLRRGLVAAAMLTLAVVAVGMAYLRLVADRNRSAAEQSAHDAHTAAKLAEERLTASLISQGRRELNDGRGLAALAYFGEALTRGADTPALRFMIGAARRAIPDEEFVRPRAGTTATVLTANGFAAADDQGRITFWSDAAKPLGELALELGPIAKLARDGDQLLAVGQRGIAVIDAAQRTQRVHVAIADPPHDAQLGPAADEVTVVSDSGVLVYAFDGSLRRQTKLPALDQPAEVVRGGGHVWFGAQGNVIVLDTRTLAQRVIGGPVQYGPYLCPNKDALVILANKHELRLLSADGTLRRTVKPTNDPLYATCSATADRIAAVSTESAEVFDGAGTKLRTVSFFDDKEVGVVRLLGDDIWTGSLDGVIRRYHDIIVVATLPSLTGRIVEMRVSDRHVIVRADDSSFVVLRGQARQLDAIEPPCASSALMMADDAVGILCGEKQHVYIGRHRVGTIAGQELAHVALEPTSQRGAVAARKLTIFDADARQLAESDAHLGAIAFADRDHVLVAEPSALWRWTFASDKWDRVLELPAGGTTIAARGDAIVIGTETKQLLYISQGRVRKRVDVAGPVISLDMSAGRVAAQLRSGVTLILDADARVLRELEPADADRVKEVLDASGALLIRSQRGTPTVWDTTTGDVLFYELDLFRYAVAVRFAKDGRLEIAGSEVGTLAIGIDSRPVSQIMREIECRVPLRVVGSRLEPRPPCTR